MTFSYSGANDAACVDALNHGYRVATVFAPILDRRQAGLKTRTTFREVEYLAKEAGMLNNAGEISLFEGEWPFVDGDSSDYRIDDPAPSIVCLNFKQPSLGRYDRAYARLWEAIPEARQRFSKRMEDPLRKGEVYSLAIRSKNFLLRFASDRGYEPVARTTDKGKLVYDTPPDFDIDAFGEVVDFHP